MKASDTAAPCHTEGQPLQAASLKSDAEEEPPSTIASGHRRRLFEHIPEELWKDWKWQFANRITSIDELSSFIPLSSQEKAELKLVTREYPLSVTPYYLCLMNPEDPDDPIRRQAIPCLEETALAGIGLDDPLEERGDSVVPGLVHRYPDRVLMVLTNICPVFCRHCTRKREWRHGKWIRTRDQVEAMLGYIRDNTSIRDVIISGGDPLVLSVGRLEEVISGLRRIRHVDIIRIGSRFPVVLPQRIDDELCSMLSGYGPVWFNTHFNHEREITPESAAACERLLRAGVPVNNQSVLLRGVNDSVEAQTRLCHGLLKSRVRPYYLFQCDEVRGTEHLRTPVDVGLKIIEGMRGHTSGLAIPTFVVDLPNGGGKVPLQPNYVKSHTKSELVLRNYEFRLFRYRNPVAQRVPKNGRHSRGGAFNSRREPERETKIVATSAGGEDENRAVVRS
ncbi:MAG: KamA family radical SAM protein [Chloroflexota bacterium]|nr:KamA family radical SAM protein [Chloroflexota bacterium]